MTTTVVVKEVSVVSIACPHNISVRVPELSVHCDGLDGKVFYGIAGVYDGRWFELDEYSKSSLCNLPGNTPEYVERAIEWELNNMPNSKFSAVA